MYRRLQLRQQITMLLVAMRISYGGTSKQSDDPIKICTGSIGNIKLTGQSQGYCTGVDSSGYNYSLEINKTTSLFTGGG